MKSSAKRLAKDQIAVRQNLPPNYFFEESDDDAALPDDLSQLRICLAGPDCTPYSQGIWHIRLNMPSDYPQSPPTAVFQTRIFHPNVAEESGAVCLETLKRDWDSKLTLKDILVTISCLLIQPNPDSALNQKAGALIQDDYDSFARQARLMTKIHAPTPQHLLEQAQAARRRGEEKDEAHSRESPQVVSKTLEQTKQAPVLQENQPSEKADPDRIKDVKPRKRSLAESTIDADGLQDHDHTENGRRKSARKNTDADASFKSEAAPQGQNPLTTTTLDKPICKPLPHPEKIVFRASWSSAPGLSRLKARVGIRRL